VDVENAILKKQYNDIKEENIIICEENSRLLAILKKEVV
jgi:hypothetical protein